MVRLSVHVAIDPRYTHTTPNSQGANDDQILGGIILGITFVAFAYFSVWILITPFDEASDIKQVFPSSYLAFSIATMVLLLLFTAPVLFIGLTLLKETAPSSNKKV
jgi:hypothetical protein